MVSGAEVVIWECDPATGAPSAVVDTVVTGGDGIIHSQVEQQTVHVLLEKKIT